MLGVVGKVEWKQYLYLNSSHNSPRVLLHPDTFVFEKIQSEPSITTNLGLVTIQGNNILYLISASKSDF